MLRDLVAWRSDVERYSLDEFCRVHAHPLLVHCRTTGELQPVDRTHGLTIDRAIVTDRLDGGWSARLGDYAAAEVVARNPARSTDITIGCSSHCDIQLNDASVSKLHALMSREIDGWHVRDASSLTGIRVNDAEPGLEPLVSGDRISIGLVELIFLLPPEVYRLVRGLGV